MVWCWPWMFFVICTSQYFSICFFQIIPLCRRILGFNLNPTSITYRDGKFCHSNKYGSGIRDPGSEIRDLGLGKHLSRDSRIRIQGSKKHRISDNGSRSAIHKHSVSLDFSLWSYVLKQRLSLYVCIHFLRKRCSCGLVRAWPPTSRSKLDLVTWWRLHSGIRRTVKKPSNFLDVPSRNTFLM